MSSKIEVQRICQHCGNEFTARTTTTQYCSGRCNSAGYKAKKRAVKIESSNSETQKVKNMPLEELKAKEFLTVREVAHLLNFSVRSVYYFIENGAIKAINLGQRATRIKRSEIDKLFEQPEPVIPLPESLQLDISECYRLSEVYDKYGVSESTLQNIIKRNNIPKRKKGWYVYVQKNAIDKLLS